MIKYKLTESQQLALCSPFSDEDVRHALYSISNNKGRSFKSRLRCLTLATVIYVICLRGMQEHFSNRLEAVNCFWVKFKN